MIDNRLKLILAILGGVIFAMIFILLALVVPVKKTYVYQPTKKATTKLEQISQEVKKR